MTPATGTQDGGAAAARRRALLAALPLMAWPLYCLARGEWRRWELLALLVLAPTLALASDATRRLLSGLYPLALVALLYDAMRFVKYLGITAERVHVCDLRALDARLFGYHDAAGGVHTVHDWLQAHTLTALDLICAVPYGTFLFAAVAFGVYLYFKDLRALQRFGWSFFFVNLAGFVTYHVYPAAPPWYFHSHGCLADLSAAASEGPNLARVDALLGVPYFHGFYGRSHDVFGAVPSLHVSYPTLIARIGWPHFGRRLRVAALAFWATMCFAAVYLDHHWIVDVLLGLTYTLVIERVVRAVAQRGQPRPATVVAKATLGGA